MNCESVINDTALEKCDSLIQKCKDALNYRDVDLARRIRDEATTIYQEVIPGWHGGLMGSYTGFYLDDVEMILGKLSIFKSNQQTKTCRDYVQLTKVVEKVMSTNTLFENTINEMKQCTFAQEADFAAILARVREFQAIAESPVSFKERWELVKPFLHWLTTLDADVAEHLLPLVMRSAK
ncbi:MAG: hypothetical protein GX749_05345 [Ruminococcaceae bacterium]|nr:hypothetical protein [Oscillospiraceae bacterium]